MHDRPQTYTGGREITYELSKQEIFDELPGELYFFS